MSDYKRILHLGDLAHTATLLCRAANYNGRSWKTLQLVEANRNHSPIMLELSRLGLGLTWELRYAFNKLLRPKIHLHSAMGLQNVRWALGDYALHLHGTDIRTQQYRDEYQERITTAVHNARVVYYSTPDLAEHTLPLRPDAILAPVPVTMQHSTAKNPLGRERKYVFFTSRWEKVKGGITQIATAQALHAMLPSNVELIGLDWGPLADNARNAGVTLIPKQKYPIFRALVRDAQICIGQTAGIMSASELDALAEGTPIVVPLNPIWYAPTHPSLQNIPVIGGTDLSQEDPENIAKLAIANLGAPPISTTMQWLRDNHSPQACLNTVLSGYRSHNW